MGCDGICSGERSGGGGERYGVGVLSEISLGSVEGEERETQFLEGRLPADLFLLREMGQDGRVVVGAEAVLRI